MKTRHYYIFEKETQERLQGSALDKKNWDILRIEGEKGFSIEKNVESYEKSCAEATIYKKAANVIYELIFSRDICHKKIISLGVGKGILEWHLKKMDPGLVIECTDYTIDAIERLKEVFLNIDRAYDFDMIEGDYARLDTDAIFLMYRVSTEFDQDQWFRIFEKMYDAEIKYIIFVPVGLDRVWDILREKMVHIANKMIRRKDIQCGWLYSESEYLKMFRGREQKPLYNIKDRKYFENTVAFLLMKD